MCMRIYAKTMKLCNIALRFEKKPKNTQIHHQACKHNKTCSCSEQHATFCGLCFQFPSPTDNLFYFMNLLRKILEYFILHYLVLVHSCTQKTENIVTHSHNEIWPRLRIHVKILWTCSITKLFVPTTLLPLTI